MPAGYVCALMHLAPVADTVMPSASALHNCESTVSSRCRHATDGHTGEQEGTSRLRQSLVRPLPQTPHALPQLRLREGTSFFADFHPVIPNPFVSTSGPMLPRLSSACGLGSVPSAGRGTRTRMVPGSIRLAAFRLKPSRPRLNLTSAYSTLSHHYWHLTTRIKNLSMLYRCCSSPVVAVGIPTTLIMH